MKTFGHRRAALLFLCLIAAAAIIMLCAATGTTPAGVRRGIGIMEASPGWSEERAVDRRERRDRPRAGLR